MKVVHSMSVGIPAIIGFRLEVFLCVNSDFFFLYLAMLQLSLRDRSSCSTMRLKTLKNAPVAEEQIYANGLPNHQSTKMRGVALDPLCCFMHPSISLLPV